MFELPLVAAAGGSSLLWRALFSFWWLLCGARAQQLWAHQLSYLMDLPGPGIEPVYLALVGRFLTTGPSGKSLPS